ncbi:COMT [Symbiodinium pilosum]|uniref:COMT protein n=1 Tax=Symbiodinium pilosum TaxID=2952 RepID=A0A812QMV5_SYMPI|nr:COMT [Symbiodinium pilosum]
MRGLLIAPPHNVDPKNLLLDESARNTIENARNTLEIMRKEAPGQEMKLYLVTSEFHSPRSEYIFKNVLDSQNASEVALEAYPAPSGLADDISDDPKKPMVRDFKVDKIMKDINEWGIFLRLCHEHTIMEAWRSHLRERNPYKKVVRCLV